MPHARNEIIAGIRRIGKVIAAVRLGMQQRSRFDPVLVCRIDFHAERARVGRLTCIIPAGGDVRERIGRCHIGERKHVFWVEVVLAVSLGATGLRETVVHADAATRRNPLHVAVEYLSADSPLIVFVKAKFSKVIEHTPGLRRNFGIDPRDVVGERIGGGRCRIIVLSLIAQPGNPIANRRKAETGDGRILGGVRELIDVVGGKILRDMR